MEGILFSVFHIIVTKKTQGISSKLFVLGQKFSNFVSRASGTFRNSLMFFALDFWQLSDALRKRLKYINVQQGLKRILNGLLDLYFYWVTITSVFCSFNTNFLSLILFLFIYLFISQTRIYTIINTSYKFKQKYVCRWPVENQNMSCRQAPLNIDIMSMKNFWSLLYDPSVENLHYRGHCCLNLKLIIIISSIQFRY